jgi:hypothetical protein
MKVNPFVPNGLPVELNDAAKGMANSLSEKELLALLLANSALSKVGKKIQITPVLDTAAYTAGDVLFNTTEIPNVLRNVGGAAALVGVVLIDQDDQTAAQIDLVFFSANVSLGTINGAPSISDANSAKVLGIVSVPSTAFVDLGGAKVATVNNFIQPVMADAGASIFVAGIARGTPTQTVSGIKLNLEFRQD